MTKEKERAIKILCSYLPKDEPMNAEDREAFFVAIDALKQEPVLDKIRAEIKSKIVKRPWLDFKDRERDRNDAFLEVLDIIDKYKTESEES